MSQKTAAVWSFDPAEANRFEKILGPDFALIQVVPIMGGPRPKPRYAGWPNPDRAHVKDLSKPWDALGVVTGHNSGGIIVIDVDIKPGKDGRSGWEQLQKQFAIPPTLRVRTPSGGYHYYYKSTSGAVATLADVRGIKGLDVRAERNGFVFHPGCAKDGKPYQVDMALPIETLPPLFEEWLPKIGARRDREPTAVGESASAAAQAFHRLADAVGGARPWGRRRCCPFEDEHTGGARGEPSVSVGDDGQATCWHSHGMPTQREARRWLETALAESAANEPAIAPLFEAWRAAKDAVLRERRHSQATTDALRELAKKKSVAPWPIVRRVAKGEMVLASELRAAIEEIVRNPPWSEMRSEDVRHVFSATLSRDAPLSDAFPDMWDDAQSRQWQEREQWEQQREAAKSALESAQRPLLLASATGGQFWLWDEVAQEYSKACDSQALPIRARAVWEGRVSLDAPTATGMRPMRPSEIAQMYGGGIVESVSTCLYSERRDWDGASGVLIEPAPRELGEVSPRYNETADRWLDALGGELAESLRDWVAWCRRDRLRQNVPALALLEASHVGKGLLAHACARTLGQGAPGGDAVLDRFAWSELIRGIVQIDETMPTDARGRPRSDELKRVITETDRFAAAKFQVPRRVIGAVRVVVSGQAATRLFRDGVQSEADSDAMGVRFLAIRIPRGGPRERACKALLQSMGDGSNPRCPERFEGIVGHLAWLQAERDCEPPSPDVRALADVLRVGGGLLEQVIEALEQLEAGGGAVRAAGRLHFRIEGLLGRVPDVKTQLALVRALEPLDGESHRARTCPLVKEKGPGTGDGALRYRWHSVNCDKLTHYNGGAD